ncbi:hypothetical protein [Pedobacter aquatilis]|uniref:hypothetical protein n=1 Tax=Pedobacter aquatilis TaxID=351343 RepID=UPI00292D6F40|nr:hypothetical protein [Pedobacter aquatilis]
MIKVDKYKAQKQIALTWMIGSCIFIIAFLVITMTRPDAEMGEWKWLIGSLSPGLTLITTSFIYASLKPEIIKSQKIDRYFMRLVNGSSLFYLFVLLIIIITIPISESDDKTMITHINKYSILIGFIQAIVLGLLGIFFSKNDG